MPLNQVLKLIGFNRMIWRMLCVCACVWIETTTTDISRVVKVRIHIQYKFHCSEFTARPAILPWHRTKWAVSKGIHWAICHWYCVLLVKHLCFITASMIILLNLFYFMLTFVVCSYSVVLLPALLFQCMPFDGTGIAFFSGCSCHFVSINQTLHTASYKYEKFSQIIWHIMTLSNVDIDWFAWHPKQMYNFQWQIINWAWKIAYSNYKNSNDNKLMCAISICGVTQIVWD